MLKEFQFVLLLKMAKYYVHYSPCPDTNVQKSYYNSSWDNILLKTTADCCF